MNSSALMLWGAVVTLPGLFAVLGSLSAMLLALGLWTARERRVLPLLALFPPAILLGLVLGRLAHWYCHPLQYTSLTEAMTDYFIGGFSLWGVFAGVLLAAALLVGANLVPDLWELLDVLAPAAALGIAVGRLGSLFDLSDRGKFILETPSLHRLPFSVYTVLSGSEGQWRFATFFVQSLFCLVLALFLLSVFFLAGKRRRGVTAIFFAICYGAGQILLDSTRYDADFFRFNGFIHVPQILSALAAAAAVGLLGRRSVRRFGLRGLHIVLFALALGCYVGCGVMEYLVQRHADRYALCYGGMAAFLLLLCLIGGVLYLWRPRRKPTDKRRSNPFV